MKKQSPPKAKRQSLAKKIFAEPNFRKKLDIAAGHATRFPFWRKQESELEIFSFLHKARGLGKKFVGKTPAEINYREIGFNLYPVLAAIADNDDKFFSKLAAMIQYRRMPDLHKRYYDLLIFCNRDGCGTLETPCDAPELAKYLELRGHKFSRYHDNQVPRTLRADCKRLGVILRGQR